MLELVHYKLMYYKTVIITFFIVIITEKQWQTFYQ